MVHVPYAMSAHISANNLPKIDRIGLFPLENSSLDFVYRNPTQVIHLFEYAGRIVIGSGFAIQRPAYRPAR